MKKALVLGAGGFIGSHMVKRLKAEGYYVVGVDLKLPSFGKSQADEFIIGDLCEKITLLVAMRNYDEIYQFAADMGGCQYLFTGEHDADLMHNSVMVNLNVLDSLMENNFKGKIFYSSSACMYPKSLQDKATDRGLKESDAYPGDPDSEYGWEKLFSERLYMAYQRNYGIDIRIARYHNIYGEESVYEGGREKAPASVSRKVVEASDIVNIWGKGDQTRSFLYIDDCIDATRLLMKSGYKFPINIGSTESVTIKQLWETAIEISGKKIKINHIDRPDNTLGVMGRNSDNTVIEFMLGWKRKYSLKEGIEKTYNWINSRVNS